jgi:hypothetical protein
MLSLICDTKDPRRLTVEEEARIAKALEPYPPIYPRRRKLAPVPVHVPTPAQPWESRPSRVELRAA